MALNPIAFTERVVEDFLRYQLTTYPLADTDLYAQLRDLLRLDQSRDTPLRKGPFISLSRPFKQGPTIAQLVADGVFHPAMTSIVPAEHTHVRAHQDEAILSIHRGDTTIVSTGTGSGKTEAFLYPIISRCLELKDHAAPPGVVAVLVYPMNALAEDQLDRLRGLLAGRGIPFGMYVGKTPEEDGQIRGERLPDGSTNADYHARLKQIREAGQDITLIPAEERASRTAMRAGGGQPRILLTNTKQLELLLTRGKDVGIFEGAPLEFLVFDEAHTFRGAQGAETACLIRRLRTFCGRAASEVRHVATSATMASADGSAEPAHTFARRFFGVDAARVTLVREVYDEQRWNERRSVPAGPPDDVHDVLNRLLKAVDDDGEEAVALSDCLVALGGARLPKTGWQSALSSQLASNELVFQLASELRTARPLSELPTALAERVGRAVPEAEILAWLALGAATGKGGHDPLLRPVAHSFVRGVGGAVVTFSNPKATARLWLAGEEAAAELGERFRRFPVITCTTCGQHYYEAWVKDFGLKVGKHGPERGDKVGDVRVWPHLVAESGGCRALLVDRLVVRPDEEEELGDQLNDDGDVSPATSTPPHPRLQEMLCCGHCGSLQEQRTEACMTCQGDAFVAVQVVRSKEEFPGLLHSCVACSSPGKRPRGAGYREPARPMRAVSVSDVHVLAQSMMHLSERPRLLVFADNRQDAAFQAGWMRDHARRFRLRAYLSQQIGEKGASIMDIVHGLDGVMEGDRELSRALLPEVWQVVPFDESGVKHREERIYFLRIQVLREIATGVKQRLGLEPWGRIRVNYVGLDAAMPFVQKWKDVLNIDADVLAEGIAALLDHVRRTRILHDATKLFEKMWTTDLKEVLYGYVPTFAGGPKGAKLTRVTGDEPARVTQWRGTRPTQVWNAVAGWGVAETDIERFLTELWAALRDAKLLVPVSLEGWGHPLRGGAGTFQIDSGKLTIHHHLGRFRCAKCRRTTIRQGPRQMCMAWRCGGKLVQEMEAGDDFDLRMLDGDYKMLRVAEHSAQVPHATRERIENQFKGEKDRLNTLVCTPTLELGVDIGALDAVLMRNVPPTPANYWQRAGRAGRRHRMAVDVTYAQATGFDQSYFRDPLKLLAGQVEPPRFNLKNEVMIRKHVHAAVLTALLGIARRASDTERARIGDVLARCFPPTLKTWLFTPGGEVLERAMDVSILGPVIDTHRTAVLAEVQRAFTSSWPTEDAAAVTPIVIERVVNEMPRSLAEVIKRLKRRLDWARSELKRLNVIMEKDGVLNNENEAHSRRCKKIIARLKGTYHRNAATAQGGAEDSDTMSALSREGFLPGYGLESGSIVGMAEPPRMTDGLDDFELPRAPSLALREYVPGNAIYANGFRFVPRRFMLTAEDTLRFRVVVEQQVVQEVGTEAAAATLSTQEIRAVQVCDVIMPSQSQISDEEEFRFQMPVASYADDRGYHRGGTLWRWADLDVRFRRGVQLRMLNVGPRNEVRELKLGFPLCLACGQSHSPFASQKSREEFDKLHFERCNHVVKPTGFYADVEVDVLGLHDVQDRKLGFSVVESIRMGAARVLDMEIEDLQILALGHVGEDRVDVLLYDPMPGGSGLLEQLTERWEEVRLAALNLLNGCVGACEASCIDCLQTYRNRFYHADLDRHLASATLTAATGGLTWIHPLPENLPHVGGAGPQTPIEVRFRRYLAAAGLPAPLCQHRIDLGPGFGHTVPDFFYNRDEDEPGICIYIDGMGVEIHGNDEQARKDAAIRARLDEKGFEVVVVRSFELDDKNAVVLAIARIADRLMGGERRRALRADTSWFERAGAVEAGGEGGEAGAAERPKLRMIRCEEHEAGAVPIYDLRIAAGAFSEGQMPEADGFARVEGAGTRRGLFIAQVVGDSMDKVAPKGAYCLWQHLGQAGVAAAAPGENIVVRRPAGADGELGEFTFKRLVETAAGRELVPVSTNPGHKSIVLTEGDEVEGVARFLGVVDG